MLRDSQSSEHIAKCLRKECAWTSNTETWPRAKQACLLGPISEASFDLTSAAVWKSNSMAYTTRESAQAPIREGEIFPLSFGRRKGKGSHCLAIYSGVLSVLVPGSTPPLPVSASLCLFNQFWHLRLSEFAVREKTGNKSPILNAMENYCSDKSSCTFLAASLIMRNRD